MKDLYPIFEKTLSRDEKEKSLGQRGAVYWLYGLSGSGKSTLAIQVERRLNAQGRLAQLLDGDNIRVGLNQDLGFSEEDRYENIRRIAEVAKLFCAAGFVTVASFITPKREFRSLARSIIGAADFNEVYVDCPFDVCADRDVKGLYAKAAAGGVKNFTGRDAAFEPPEGEADLTINTAETSVEDAVNVLMESILSRVEFARSEK